MHTLVCAGFATSMALLTAWLARQLRGSGHSGAPASFVVRRHWLLRGPIGYCSRRLAPLIPSAARAAARGALERAGLDQAISADEWMTVQALAAAIPTTICTFLVDASTIELILGALLAFAAGCAAPWLWLRDHIARLRSSVLRELPGYLDLLTLGLEAGCAFGAALQIAVRRSMPGPLRTALEHAIQEMRAGRSRAEALQRMQRRLGIAALSATVAAVVQADATGVSLAPVIRAQSIRGTQQRFARAEKLAMEAPVKMLAPLVLCIFPCTFIVVGFPIAVRLFWGT